MRPEYLLTTSIGFVLLYMGYKMVLSKLTFFQTNRWVLLLGSAIVLVAPLIPMNQDLLNGLGVNGVIQLPEIEVGASRWVASTDSILNFGKMIYWTGFVLALIWLIWSVIHALRIISTGERVKSVVMAPAATPAFSFFRTIVIPEGTDGLEYEAIVRHESVHADQLHSVDRIVFGIIKAVFWFNPFVWLLEKELVQVHEYLADEGTLEELDQHRYSQVLLDLATGIPMSFRTNTVNTFSAKSIIKNRFKMMNSKRSNPISLIRYALILPAIAALILVSCTDNPIQVADPKIYNEVDNKPEYPGGFGKVIEHIQSSIKYPEDARSQGIEGQVYVSFVVNEDGSMSDVKAENVVFPSIDAQAVQVVSTLGEWNPGTVGGKPVKVRLVLPITYLLSDQEEYHTPEVVK